MTEKQISLGKVQRIAALPDSMTFIKLSQRGFIPNDFIGLETFSDVKLRFLHNGFIYESREVPMYHWVGPRKTKIGTRIIGVRKRYCEKLLEGVMKKWINMEEVINRAGFQISKKHKLCIAHDLSNPFE